MAICNFRADALGLASEAGIELERIVDLLEKAARGDLSMSDLGAEGHAFFEVLKRKGLVDERSGTYCLRKQGREILDGCRALLKASPTR
jgi:hypothetical protein